MLEALRRQLYSGKVKLQTAQGVTTLMAEQPGSIWIVARALCVFRLLDVDNVPASRRAQVISAQIPLLSPYKTPGFWFCVQEGEAKIWIWDESLRGTLTTSEDKNCLVVPESCYSPAKSKGTFFYKASQGYFCQSWADNELIADYWWNEEPEEADWQTTLRGAGVSAPDTINIDEVDIINAEPWHGEESNLLAQALVEPLLSRVAILVFLFFLSFQLVGYTRLSIQQASLEKEVGLLSENHQVAFDLSEKTYDLRRYNDAIVDSGGLRQLLVLDSVAEALPQSAASLILWKFSQDGLEFVVEDSSPDFETYVRQLEELPFIVSVNVLPLKNSQLKVVARLALR